MSPNIGLRIPTETLERLQVLADANGCTVSDVVRQAITQYLESPQSPALGSTEARLSAVEQAIAELSATVSRLSAPVSAKPSQKPKAAQKTEQAQASAGDSSLLTTSEAFAELKQRSWQGETTTLRRKLRGGIVPADLARFGLKIDPDGLKRRRETPKDNRVKWLFFEQ